MKREIIIFQEKKPKNRSEICNCIEHFCRVHDFQYEILNHRGPVEFSIEGEVYRTELIKKQEEKRHYWMICCNRRGMTGCRA